jgi:hypothetical protein
MTIFIFAVPDSIVWWEEKTDTIRKTRPVKIAEVQVSAPAVQSDGHRLHANMQYSGREAKHEDVWLIQPWYYALRSRLWPALEESMSRLSVFCLLFSLHVANNIHMYSMIHSIAIIDHANMFARCGPSSLFNNQSPITFTMSSNNLPLQVNIQQACTR